MAADSKSLALLNTLHPAIKDSAIRAYTKACRITPVGVHPYITETSRSFERSDKLYMQPWDGKDNDGDGKIDEADEKVSNAKGGDSLHNYDLAIDFTILVNGKMRWVVDKNWMLVVQCFKEEGFTWGGDFKSLKDAPHVEKTMGNSLSKIKQKYKNNDFISGTRYIRL